MFTRPIYSYNDITSSFSPKREIGISIQFEKSTTFNPLQVFQSTYTTTQQTKNQLINYILTNPGERFFDPTFGSGIRNLLFEQQQDFTSLEENLKDLIELYVQNIIVKSVNITPQENNSVTINLYYSINNITDQLTVQLNNEITGEVI